MSTFAGGNNYVSARSYSDRCPTRTCELYVSTRNLLGSTRIRPFATLEGVVPSRSDAYLHKKQLRRYDDLF